MPVRSPIERSTSRPGLRMASALVPVVLLLPTSAHAEKVVTADSVGDVQLVTTSLPVGIPPDVTTAPAPDETAVDITRTVVAHGNARLSVTVHLRDLVLTSIHETSLRLVTPEGPYDVLVGRNPGFKVRSVLLRRGLETDCRALRAAVDGEEDTVMVSLPTVCLGAPRWVRTGVGVTRVADRTPADAYPSESAVLADDGHRDVVRESSLALGPRVRRG